MGTNWYWRDSPCGFCGRFEEIHVGKSGFTFRAYRHELMNTEYPDWGYNQESPFGFPVLSVADWRRVFTDRPGSLWDEYGKQADETPLDWLASMPPWQITPDRQRWLDSDMATGDGWLDAEGYRFYAGEFS
jgi:hypothetical protein